MQKLISGLVAVLMLLAVPAAGQQLRDKRPPGCHSWTNSCNSCRISARGPACTNVTCVRAGPVRCTRRIAMPRRCRGYYDGCNTCVREPDGTVHCSTLVCRTWRKPVCQAWTGSPPGLPADCVRWFDGCNTCGRSRNGTIICSRRYCGGKTGTPRCLQRRRG